MVLWLALTVNRGRGCVDLIWRRHWRGYTWLPDHVTVKILEYKTGGRIPAYENYYHVQQKLQCILGE